MSISGLPEMERKVLNLSAALDLTQVGSQKVLFMISGVFKKKCELMQLQQEAQHKS